METGLEPPGFSHGEIQQNGVTYVKRPDQGKMKDVAFIQDPDGYWIEIVQPSRLSALGR
jgi:lactoylglutathione lyase